MSSNALTELERKKISAVFVAVTAGDWQKFKSLSDETFLNEASMHEQFEDSRRKVKGDFPNWEHSVSVGRIEDGTRLITIQLQPKSPHRPINLILHSSSNGVGIWVFAEEFDPYA